MFFSNSNLFNSKEKNMFNVYFYENCRGFVDVRDVSDEYVGIDKIEDVVSKIYKEEYSDEAKEDIKFWYGSDDIKLEDIVNYNEEKDICYIDYSEELGYWIFKDRDLFDRDDIDVEDILDVCECEVFDLDIKDINERMFNIINS